MEKTLPRIAIYGRHSTDKQNPSSSNDQAAACLPLVEYLGGQIVGTYLDPEVSGYRRDRPGLKRLLHDVRSGSIDIIVSESLDRIARDAEDVAWIGKKLKFDRVALWTISENEIDDVKFAVAAMMGALFLSQLRQKVHRGLSAAVLAGRFAGGRAYGYKKITGFDDRGRPLTGLLAIDPHAAEIVRQIHTWFAAGLSSVQIATRLNDAHVPSPRGGNWNGSTIRGDPKKLVGILNNPLYVGELVWNRREWRKNPDSDRRERLYRLRGENEWYRVAVPDLRIIDDALRQKVQAEIESRRRAPGTTSPVYAKRKTHLLSGLIKCSVCGANYTISGKDYYRCAGKKERGTCNNSVSIRKAPIENATLSVLQHQLLTEDHVRIFVEEFRREAARLMRQQASADDQATERLRQVEIELENLTQNMLAGVLSPTLSRLLAEREAEKAQLLARLSIQAPASVSADILPHPTLLKHFEEKVASLRTSLNDDAIRTEASGVIDELIDSVTIYPDGPNGPEAEVVARTEALIGFATNDNAAPKGGVSSSIMVVAGAGFEPATFRL